MLTPEYLESAPDRMIELWAQAERDILSDMARKISTYDYFSAASEWQAVKLKEMGLTYEEILRRLSLILGKTREELKRLLNEAGIKTLQEDDATYKAAGKAPGPIKDNAALVAIMAASLKKTENSFYNLCATTAKNGAEQFIEELDRAYMQVVTGGMDINTATREAIKRLADKGIRTIKYPSGHVDYVDVAVRRAVRTGVNQTALQLQLERIEEMGEDLVETSAHSGARPSHAEWQGKVFSLSGKSDKYPNFYEATGYGTVTGLGGANCRHSFYPFFGERAYTDKELAKLNEKKYEYRGKMLTEYEATQVQRYNERQIRKYKREQAMLKAVGEPQNEARAKVKQWQVRQTDFIDKTGLKRRLDAENIPKYK